MTGTVDVTVPERPEPRPGVETAFLAPEVVLLETATGRVHHLNPGASAVWLLLDGELSVAGIAGELADLFGRSPSAMMPEVEAAVADFAARRLLVGTDTREFHAGPAGRAGRAGDAAVLPRPPDP